MATNTAGDVGRELPFQATHFLRKAISKADATLTLDVGTLPPGAVVVRAYVVVTEAFNAGTNNRLDIGTEDDTDDFATDLALGTVGVIAADEMATANNVYNATSKKVQCVVDVTGTAATTGAGIVVVEYIPNNDG
jgi:hypothetical protein